MFWTIISEEKNLSPINASISEKSSKMALIEAKQPIIGIFWLNFLLVKFDQLFDSISTIHIDLNLFLN